MIRSKALAAVKAQPALSLTLAASAVLALSLWTSAKLATFGVESALLFGLLLPPFAGLLAARSHQTSLESTSLGSRIAAAMGWGLAPVCVVAVIQMAALAHFPACNPLEGLGFFLLGPVIGCAFATLVGSCLVELGPKRLVLAGRNRAPMLLASAAFIIPLLAVASGALEFYRTPAIFVFGHFAGWFPGTLYDVGTSIPLRYLSFRGITALWAGGSLSLLWAGSIAGAPFSWRLVPSHPVRGLLSAVCLSAALVGTFHAPALGHRSTSESIAEALGKTLHSSRCVLHLPRELPLEEQLRLARDCDFRVAAAEGFLGVNESLPVHAFFFRSPEEKQQLMGAKNTFIAKPWLGQVYLQIRPWPHPVLAHEIAHVVARNCASGPFGISGTLGGWLPDGGLIEGLAVATDWNTRSGLTPHQWSRAMLENQRLPDVESLVGLSFLTLPPRDAYTSAGSLLRFVRDRYGAAALRKSYRHASLRFGTGESLAQLEGKWRDFLRQVPFPDETRELAKLRFSGQGFFSAVCPHEVAKLKASLGMSAAAGDFQEVREACQAILKLDPNDVATKLELEAIRELQSTEQAHRILEQHRQDGVPAAALATLQLRWADEAWRAGKPAMARALLEELVDSPLEESTRRAIDVRMLGLQANTAEQAIVYELLVGPTAASAPPALAVHLAHRLAELRNDGLGPYLEARQLWFAGRYREALTCLQRGVALGLPTRTLRTEARRMVGLLLVANNRDDEAADHLSAWSKAQPEPNIQAFIDDWQARIAWRRQHPQ